MAKADGFKSYAADFIDGMARIFDFTGSLDRPRYTGNGFEDDIAALRSDWIAVGNDLRAAMGHFEIQEAEREAPPH
jgi:hypothetical protein